MINGQLSRARGWIRLMESAVARMTFIDHCPLTISP
jgi:hypothetical protein